MAIYLQNDSFEISDLSFTLSLLVKPEHERLHSGPELPNKNCHLFLQMSPAQLAKRALFVLLLAFARVYHLDLNLNRDSPDADVKKGFRKVILKAHARDRARARASEREREREREGEREREREKYRERARDPTHHTFLLCESLGTRRRKIHGTFTISQSRARVWVSYKSTEVCSKNEVAK